MSCLRCLIRRTGLIKLHNNVRGIASTDNNETVEKKVDNTNDKIVLEKTSLELEDLTEPTTCCMSGCVNCVWIEYAEKLSKSMANSNEDVQKLIMEKVQDPNMRAFLSLELRCRNLIQ